MSCEHKDTWIANCKAAVKEVRAILVKYLEEEQYSLQRYERHLPSKVHETLSAQTKQRIERLKSTILKIDECS